MAAQRRSGGWGWSLLLAFSVLGGLVWSGWGCCGEGGLRGPFSWLRPSRSILVNLVGYQVGLPKRALLLNPRRFGQEGWFQVVSVSDGRLVTEISPSEHLERDGETGDRLQVVNFGRVEKPGIYVLRGGGLASAPFTIADGVFQETIDTLLRSYLYQRCGVALRDPKTGASHPPCHVAPVTVARDDPYHRRGDPLRITGGWHDAGDFGRYASTTAVTVGRLLFLAEQFPEFAHDDAGLPESGNGVPDILDEAAVGIRWLLAMQRPDGAEYRKLAGKRWPPPGSPDTDDQPLFVYGISTHETAKAAAVFAMAARMYQDWDPDLASTAARAARSAWAFLETHPQPYADWQPDDDSGSGCYVPFDDPGKTRLRGDLPDRFWAAAEWYLSTGDPAYRAWLEAQLPDMPYTLFGWADPSAQGMLDLLLARDVPARWRSAVRSRLTGRAKQLLDNIVRRKSVYANAAEKYVWGSNRNVAENGVTLALAYLFGDPRAIVGVSPDRFLEEAVHQADYLLGMNHFGTSFVTGVGTRSVRHLAHAHARTLAFVLPGFLVGGPNAEAQDGVAPGGRGPLSWMDRADSYATNENAIDYNPPLMTLLLLLTRVGGLDSRE